MPNIADIIEVAEELEDKAIIPASKRCVAVRNRNASCRKCIDACPMRLMPVLMYKSWQDGDVQKMKENNIMDCIECGSCAYTCPASVPLVLGFRVAKQAIRNASAPVKK